jgi:hypothetical protein
VKSDSSFVVNGRISLASVPMKGDTKATFGFWVQPVRHHLHLPSFGGERLVAG